MNNIGNKKYIYTGLAIILLILGFATGVVFYQQMQQNRPQPAITNKSTSSITLRESEKRQYSKESIASAIIDRTDSKYVRPNHIKPTLYFIGGTSGAGKSTLITAGSINTANSAIGSIRIPDTSQAVHIDPDQIKTGLRGWDRNNPGVVHQESKEITDYTLEKATETKLDVVVQGTGKRTKHLIEARKAGYRIIGHFVWVPDQEAMRRIQSRYTKGGNNIPPYFGKKIANEIRLCLYSEQISHNLYDHFYLWDNSAENNVKPKLIAYYRKGKGHAIINNAAFDNFFGDSSDHVRKHWESIK